MRTTNINELKTEYGLSYRVENQLKAMLSRGDIDYKLQMVSTKVMPLDVSPYTRMRKGMVFNIDDAIDAAAKLPNNRGTVAVYQYNRDVKMREEVFAELSLIRRKMHEEKPLDKRS